jgi:serine/threonine protein kinase
MGCCDSAPTKDGDNNNNNTNNNKAGGSRKHVKGKDYAPGGTKDEAHNRVLLDRMLANFGGIHVSTLRQDQDGGAGGGGAVSIAARLQLDSAEDMRWMIDLAKTPYRLYPPRPDRAKLGEGGFSTAYVVQDTRRGSGSKNASGGSVDFSPDAPHGPLFCVKIIRKATITGHRRSVAHLAAELAVALFVSPRSQHLNKALALFHSDTHVFIILELLRPDKKPDVLTRIAHIVVSYAPSKIPEIGQLQERLLREAEDEGVGMDRVGEWAETSGWLYRLALASGASMQKMQRHKLRGEVPVQGDLFKYVVAQGRRFVPEPVCKVLMKQLLIGLRDLHDVGVVHRDVKLENAVSCVHRRADVLFDEELQQPYVVVTERFSVCIIDYGLAKWMRVGGGNSAAPSGLTASSGSGLMVPTASSLRRVIDSSDSNSKQHQQQQQHPDVFADASIAMMHSHYVPSMAISPKPGDDSDHAHPHHHQHAPPPHTNPEERGLAVAVTAGTCTISYSPLEVLAHINDSESAFVSDSHSLPKVDIFGIGIGGYIASQSRAPFREAKAVPAWAPRQQKVDALKQAHAAGVQFRPDSECPLSQPFKAFVAKLMAALPADRPTASEALADPIFDGVGDTVVSRYFIDGSVQVTCVASRDVAAELLAGDGGEEDDKHIDGSERDLRGGSGSGSGSGVMGTRTASALTAGSGGGMHRAATAANLFRNSGGVNGGGGGGAGPLSGSSSGSIVSIAAAFKAPSSPMRNAGGAAAPADEAAAALASNADADAEDEAGEDQRALNELLRADEDGEGDPMSKTRFAAEEEEGAQDAE